MAHKLARQLTKIRKDGTLSYLRPDGCLLYTSLSDPDKVVDIIISAMDSVGQADVTDEEISSAIDTAADVYKRQSYSCAWKGSPSICTGSGPSNESRSARVW